MIKKSLLTLVLCALVGMISAQSLQFELNGNPCEEGQTVIGQYYEDWGDYHLDFYIRNLTDNDLQVVIQREVMETVDGATTYFCWGSCLSPELDISRDVLITAQTLSTDMFECHVMFDEGASGVVTVKYTAFDMNNPEDKVSVIVLMGEGANVVEHTVNVGSAYPNPASSMVHFNYTANNSSDINVVVYNLLGQEVKSQIANGTQGRINIAVDDLQPGIYFCSFSVDNEVVRTEKFIVKR